MNQNIIVTLITVLGTVIGASLGAIATARLTQYRLKSLEKSADAIGKNNSRLGILESKNEESTRRLCQLEKEVGKIRDLVDDRCD